MDIFYESQLKKRNYSNMGELGRGAFGVVFKVKLDEKHYAVKVIDFVKVLENNAASEKRSEKEVFGTLKGEMIQMYLVHPNIVTLFECWCESKNKHLPEHSPQSQARIFLRFELCRQNLKQWFDLNCSRERDMGQCLKMYHEIALGLQFIHYHNLIHRDLKPENILISFDGMCKITDLGISVLHHKYGDKSESHTKDRGTYLYKPFEQRESRNYNRMADMFPMGVILTEFLNYFQNDDDYISVLLDLSNHQLPNNIINILDSHQHKELNQILLNIISKLISFEPKDRYSSSNLAMVIKQIIISYCEN